MAKSEGYFVLRRGSTKLHTFQVSDGKQITKDHVGTPKKPRTLRQMNQRLLTGYRGNRNAKNVMKQGIEAIKVVIIRYIMYTLCFFCNFAKRFDMEDRIKVIGYWLLVIGVSVFQCFNSSIILHAQTAYPTISYTYTETMNNELVTTDVEMNQGDEQSANAPLTIKMFGNLDGNVGWESKCEWKIYDPKNGESKPILDRFEENTTYTLEKAGTYYIKFYVTFSQLDEEDFEYESDIFKLSITESKLSCPDGFSPNDDGKNDKFLISYQSIVKMKGVIVNRWGQKIYSFDLSNVDQGWDGRQNGKYVKDGVYFLNLQAVGSDGVKYDIRKAINVLKGFREYDE